MLTSVVECERTQNNFFDFYVCLQKKLQQNFLIGTFLALFLISDFSCSIIDKTEFSSLLPLKILTLARFKQICRPNINPPLVKLCSLVNLLKVARPGGVEPPTSRSVVGRSIQLSYGRLDFLVEREGFEPSCPKKGLSLSRRALLTTQPSLQKIPFEYKSNL